MTRDEIVEIAWDVGLFMRSHKFQDEPTKLERFAERIVAAERKSFAEECEQLAKHAKETGDMNGMAAALALAITIRARGEV